MLLLLVVSSAAPQLLLARSENADPRPRYRIVLLYDGPSDRLDRWGSLFEREVRLLLELEADLSFEEVRAGWSRSAVEDAVGRIEGGKAVDLVIGVGVISSQVLAQREHPRHPAIAPMILDPGIQGLGLGTDGGTGRDRLAFLSRPAPLESDLRVFAEITPLDRIVVLVDAALLELLGSDAGHRLASLAGTLRSTDGRELEIEVLPVGEEPGPVLAALGGSPPTLGVYVTPLFQLDQDGRAALLSGLVVLGLPTFSFLGQTDVDEGFLAGRRSRSADLQMARRVAIYAKRILSGEPASGLPTVLRDRQSLTINMDTARATGISPRYAALDEAELVGSFFDSEAETLSLTEAVDEAVKANLDLRARQFEVASAAAEVDRARTVLRPSIDLGVRATQIDEDRAGSLLSPTAERSATASLELQQLLYSDAARGNIDIQIALREERELALEQLRLDIARDTAIAYLNVLRARVATRVQREDLRRTRSHHELAQIRRDIGAGGPGEVYRWENQLATSKRSLIESIVGSEQARLQLARLLHREIDAAIVLEDIILEGIEDKSAPREGLSAAPPRQGWAVEELSPGPVLPYLDTPRNFALFGDFLVREGLEAAPELARFDRLIDAQERTLEIRRSAFFLPSVAAVGKLDHVFAESGTSSPAASLGLEPRDTTWSLSLIASLPLWSGGERNVALSQAEIELSGLRAQRAAVAEKLEQKIRSDAQAVRASYRSLELDRRAAEAAERNLELVTDAYSRGAADLLPLLDAQTASLLADEAANNATYDYLIDMIEVQRSINGLAFFLDAAQRRSWFERLDRFFATHGD